MCLLGFYLVCFSILIANSPRRDVLPVNKALQNAGISLITLGIFASYAVLVWKATNQIKRVWKNLKNKRKDSKKLQKGELIGKGVIKIGLIIYKMKQELNKENLDPRAEREPKKPRDDRRRRRRFYQNHPAPSERKNTKSKDIRKEEQKRTKKKTDRERKFKPLLGNDQFGLPITASRRKQVNPLNHPNFQKNDTKRYKADRRSKKSSSA